MNARDDVSLVSGVAVKDDPLFGAFHGHQFTIVRARDNGTYVPAAYPSSDGVVPCSP